MKIRELFNTMLLASGSVILLAFCISLLFSIVSLIGMLVYLSMGFWGGVLGLF